MELGPRAFHRPGPCRAISSTAGASKTSSRRAPPRPAWRCSTARRWRTSFSQRTATPSRSRSLGQAVAARPEWIIDGNYGATLDVRLPCGRHRGLLHVSPWLAVAGILKRWLRHRGREVQAAGCPEHFDAEFLRWAWRYRRDSHPRVLAALSEYAGSAEIVVVRSRADARSALARASAAYSSSPMAPSASAGS
jgi:hypothetical protein